MRMESFLTGRKKSKRQRSRPDEGTPLVKTAETNRAPPRGGV